MPEPKAQLVDPQGPIDVPGMQVTGVTTATGGFVGQVQGTATGFAATTYNLNVGVVTATKFQGNTTGNVSGLADDTNINVGIITSTSFTGDLVGNAAGLSTTTANINAGIMSATSFAGNFTGVASGITGTPNVVVGLMTGTLKGDGSSLTGVASTNWITNNVTADGASTTVDLNDGNTVIFTQSANTTVSFANTGTSNIVTFIRKKDATATPRTITWPDSINWDGGSAPTLISISGGDDVQVFNLLTRNEGVTWYGWESMKNDAANYSLWAWGYNNRGQLGQNNVTNYSSPVQIPSITWSKVFKGYAEQPRSMAGKSDGTLWTWGVNSYGELGLNTNGDHRSSPVQIPGTWASASWGSHSTFSINTDGELLTWGQNESGQLGHNNVVHYSSPVQVPGTTWSKVAGGWRTSYAIKTDGTLWTLGSNSYGQLGVNNRTEYSSPVQVGSDTTWGTLAHSAGKTSTAAVKTDGTLWMWGNNWAGQLAQNNRSKYSSPVQVPGTTWNTVSASYRTYMATKTDGTLWAWGSNDHGALGQNQNSGERRSSPVQIPGTDWSGSIVQLEGSGPISAAVKTDGTLWSWGYGNYGGLGVNNVTEYSSPVQVGSDTTWSDVSGGDRHMFSIRTAS